MSEYAWVPTVEYVERANVTRLMRTHNIESIDQLRARSIEDVAWFWDAVVKDLDIKFKQPYDKVVDSSQGIEWSKWFTGGKVNVTEVCVDRWAEDPQTADSTALIGESEDGSVKRLSFKELRQEVDALALALKADGIGKGDAVGVFMPMVIEAAIAMYATAKIGAIYLPIFSGFAPSAIAARLNDAEAKVVITADGSLRRTKPSLMKPTCDEAIQQAPSVKRVVVYSNVGGDVPMQSGRDLFWSDYLQAYKGKQLEAELTDSEDVFMLAYTSGTTGKPKGAVHVHGGFLVKIAAEAAYQGDIHPGDTLYWVTDMGWIMGPWSLIGANSCGACMVLYEGAPDYPDPDRVWQSVQKHKVTMLGISPTLIRALKSKGESWVDACDLSSVRTIGSTGEPWNPEPYRWLMERFDSRVPIINISGGTEVGACFLSPHPVEPIKECSLGGPALGMAIDVFDPEGNPIRDQVGELVCKQPWPGMTRGVWGDHERYLSSYWSFYPGIWRHGDWAKIDSDGQWFLYGRSDEAINVAGKRLGPAEVESILVANPAVKEAATIGVPHETKGEAVWCFWVPVDSDGEDVSEALRAEVAEELGKPFKPARTVRVPALPKTRSAKILRRAVRAVALGEDPGDLSSAENPESLEQIATALSSSAVA